MTAVPLSPPTSDVRRTQYEDLAEDEEIGNSVVRRSVA
jgi:hypothetical protein